MNFLIHSKFFFLYSFFSPSLCLCFNLDRILDGCSSQMITVVVKVPDLVYLVVVAGFCCCHFQSIQARQTPRPGLLIRIQTETKRKRTNQCMNLTFNNTMNDNNFNWYLHIVQIVYLKILVFVYNLECWFFAVFIFLALFCFPALVALALRWPWFARCKCTV